MTFFSSGVIGFAAGDATVADIPYPSIIDDESRQRAMRTEKSACSHTTRLVADALRWIKLS
ncbi:MAG: hypothetical protein WCP77_02585 [Roseococcus sp.]